MTEEEWTERLRVLDRCREAHARTLDAFRAQVEAARRTLSRVIGELEADRSGHGEPGGHRPRLKRSWRARAARPESHKHARGAEARLRDFTADGLRWSV